MSKTKSKPFKPYSLKCAEGIIVEVRPDCFIGIDADGGFRLVDDICDAYIGVKGEFTDEIYHWVDLNDGEYEGYPKEHRVKSTLTILSTKTIEL